MIFLEKLLLTYFAYSKRPERYYLPWLLAWYIDINIRIRTEAVRYCDCESCSKILALSNLFLAGRCLFVGRYINQILKLNLSKSVKQSRNSADFSLCM